MTTTKQAVRRSASALTVLGLSMAFLVLGGISAWATAMSIGPQAMEGDLRINPGDVVRAGVSFSVPGSHPWARVELANSQVTFPNVVCVTGTGGGSFTVPLGTVGANVPQDDNSWFPTGDQSSPASYQGSIGGIDLCHGGTMSLRNGGVFSGDAQDSCMLTQVNVRFHYSANGSAGSWSATQSVAPSEIGSTAVPASAMGGSAATALIALVAIGWSFVARRRRSLHLRA
jgi:hypothetical protein